MRGNCPFCGERPRCACDEVEAPASPAPQEEKKNPVLRAIGYHEQTFCDLATIETVRLRDRLEALLGPEWRGRIKNMGVSNVRAALAAQPTTLIDVVTAVRR